MVYDCTGPRFKNLKNPYTGEPLRPKLSVTRLGVKFFAPDTYSPMQPRPTAKEAYRAWNRVDGLEGAKDGRPITCAWTGRPLKLVKDGDGYRYEGGYDPRTLLDRAAFLHFASMRDGVSEYPPPGGPAPRVDQPPARPEITEGMKRHADASRTELTDDAVRTAEGIMEKHRADLDAGPATVSMASPARKPRPGQRRSGR